MYKRQVYVYGNKESQERYAAKIGIDKEHYSPQDINADYVFECVGKNETINQAIELCAPAGHIAVSYTHLVRLLYFYMA